MGNYNSSYTGTEIDRVIGYGILVTSDIQGQLDSKENVLTKGDLTESTSSVLTLTGNTNAIIGSGLTIQVKQASTGQSGYLSNTDWNTFNSKQSAITGAASTITSLDLSTNLVLISNGSGKVAVSGVSDTTLGYLDATSSIQTQLNAKEPTLSKGNLTELTSSILTIGNGTNAVIGSGTTITVAQSTTSTSGYLSSTDWNTFNDKQDAITGAASTITSSDLSIDLVLISNGSGKVATSSVSSTTLEYLDATSSIQTQLDGKEPTLTKGNLTETTSSILTISNGTNAIIGSGTSIEVSQADSVTSGYISSTDWNIFNNKENALDKSNIEGTTNQVNVTTNTNTIIGATPITLSLPQSIDTGASITFNDLTLSSLTASRAAIIDGSKAITHSIITSTELEKLTGVTENVQTSLDSKQKELWKKVDASGNGDYTGVKEALDDGATNIFIKDGTYLEATPIELTTNNTQIVGESILNTIIQFGYGQDGIRIYANGCQLQNFTMDAQTNTASAALVLGDGQTTGDPDTTKGNNNIINYCRVLGVAGTFGVYVAGASYYAGTPTLNAFEDNDLQYNNRITNCILESDWEFDSFSFSLQKNGVFSNNYCVGGRIAFYMCRDSECNNNIIIDSAAQGIFVGCPAYNNSIIGNKIYNTTSSGIKVENQLEHTPLSAGQCGFNNNIMNNVIYLSGSHGIEISGQAGNEPFNNNFSNNTLAYCDFHGIYLINAIQNNVNENLIYQAKTDTGNTRGSGIYLIDNVTDTNINENIIIDERSYVLHTAIGNRELTTCPRNSVIGNKIIAPNSERTVWIQSNEWIVSNNYISGGYYAGIYLDGADNCNVTGNICENNTNETNNAYYEIWLNNTADNNIISNNTCISSAANVANADITVSSGTGNKIENNIGIGTTGEYATILSGLQDMGAGTGIIAQTGNTSFSKRTLTGTANQVTVTNGDGVSGNPTFSVPTAFYVGAGQVGRDANNYMDVSTNNVISFKTNNTANQLVINSGGNIGVNTADIEAWSSAYTVFQFPVAAIAAGSTTADLCLVNNAYNDGTMKFRADGYAQKISLEADGHIDFNISKQSGIANNTITWTNTFCIDNNGLLTIENKNVGDNAYGLNITTENEDQNSISCGICFANSGGSFVASGNTSNYMFGLNVQNYIDSASHEGTLTNLTGVLSLSGIADCGSGGTVTNNIGVSSVIYGTDSQGTITNSYMFRGLTILGSTPATITNNWGLYIEGCDKNYIEGNVGIGITPTELVDIQLDQNSGTYLRVRNETSDTGAFAAIGVSSSGWSEALRIYQLSAAFTTSGLYAANSACIVSNGNTAGLRIFTGDAYSLILGTNNISALTIDSSQNATFAGDITISNLSSGNGYLASITTGGKLSYTSISTTVLSTKLDYLDQAVLTTSSPTFAGASFTDSFTMQKDQNTETILKVRNDTIGSGASSVLVASYSTTQYTILTERNPSYSTYGLNVANSACLLSNGNANGLRVFTEDATSLIFGTNNTARMTFADNSNIITANTITLNDTSKTGRSLYAYTTGAAVGDLNGIISARASDNNSNWVSIGCESANNYGWISSANGSGYTDLYIYNSGTYFKDGTHSFKIDFLSGIYIGAESNHALYLQTNNATRMTIDNTGIGIGVSPSYSLDIQNDQNAATYLRIRNDTSGTAAHSGIGVCSGDFTAYGIMQKYNTSFTTSGLRVANAVGIVSYGNSNGMRIFTADAYSLILGTNDTAALTIDSSQNATFAGTVDCGTSCEANAYTVGGTAGVDFSGAITNLTVVKGIVTAAS